MRKKIRQGQTVEVGFSPRERVLVLEHTFTGPDLTTTLRRAQLGSGRYVVRYTLNDLDELLGFVAAEANHSTDKKLRRELDALYVKVRREVESYDDGLVATRFLTRRWSRPLARIRSPRLLTASARRTRSR